MGLIDSALGNAKNASKADVDKYIAPILVAGETVSHAYSVGVLQRDLLLLTNLRLIVMDKTGMTGKKIHTSSYPWSVVLNWTMSTSGIVDFDQELTVTMKGSGTLNRVVVFKFGTKVDVNPVCRAIGDHVLLGK